MQSCDWLEGLKGFSWKDLEEWAGKKVAGKTMEQMDRLRDVMLLEDRGAVAIVLGKGKPHAVSIVRAPTVGFLSVCTCSPWGAPCEHAAALLWVCREAAREGRSFPQMDTKGLDLEKLDWPVPDDYDEDGWEDDDLDDREGFREYEAIKPQASFKAALNKMKKADLVDLIMQAAYADEDIFHVFEDLIEIGSGDPARIVAVLKGKIRGLADSLDGLWGYADLAPYLFEIRDGMDKLLDMEAFESVVQVGEVLWDNVEIIAEADEEDDFNWIFSDCMETAMEACLQSSLSSGEKLVWLVNRLMEDHYCLLGDCDRLLEESGFTREDWSFAAKAIKELVKALLAQDARGAGSSHGKESELIEWLCKAMENAGEGGLEEALEHVAQATGKYTGLIAYYEKQGDWKKTVNCIVNSLNEHMKTPGATAWSLFSKLIAMAEDQGDLQQVVALAVEKFCFRPDLEGYQDIRKISEKLNIWPSVRKGLTEILNTGERPESLYQKEKSGPLPEPWIKLPKNKNWKVTFPYYALLIQAAAQDERFDDAVQEYRRCAKQGNEDCTESGLFLAEVLEDSHPEFVIEILQTQVVRCIEQKKKKAYLMASKYLEKIKIAYGRLAKENEWRAYHQQLLKDNRRRPKMVQILEKLED